jgi:hypothetical protein
MSEAEVNKKRLELLQSAPPNSWVALSAEEDRIVAVGATFVQAEEAAQRSGAQGYFLVKIPDSNRLVL